MNGTVKENICMGLDFDKEMYGQMILACGLNADFARFANGDNTIIGNNGAQCSGGQKARIGLARTLSR